MKVLGVIVIILILAGWIFGVKGNFDIFHWGKSSTKDTHSTGSSDLTESSKGDDKPEEPDSSIEQPENEGDV